jgi:hypothetical protein
MLSDTVSIVSSKQGTTLRLSPELKGMLKNASRVVDRSNSDIAEEALRDWLAKHKLLESYQVTVTKTNIILSKQGNDLQILEVSERNGVPPRETVLDYQRKLQAPVRLVIQEESTWPKKQS